MSFVTLIPQSGALWNELWCKVNAASRLGEIDDTWLDHFFQTVALDAKIDAMSSAIHLKSSVSSSTAPGKRPPIHKACEQCFQSSTTGRFLCPHCGYDHCEHMHRRGKKPEDDSTRKNTTTTPLRPKALLTTAPVLEVMEDGEDNPISTNDIHGSPVNNETDFESCVDCVDCYPTLLSPLQQLAALLTSDPIALAALVQNFQALFDSGCTHHIIRDRSYFWTYHPEGAVAVGTASSGILSMKARGIVKLRVQTNSALVVLTLHDCLHGPDSPFNLLSVGAFLEA